MLARNLPCRAHRRVAFVDRGQRLRTMQSL
jgi:hypothetical protein